MSFDGFLQIGDMEQSRSPYHLCAWVDSKLAELCKTPEGIKLLRSGKLLPKKLLEEIRPFSLFALSVYGNERVLCTSNLSNDNYDGKIEFPNDGKPSVFVEVTYAKDGNDERKRISMLESSISVSAIGKVRVSGTKASRRQKVEVAPSTASNEELVERSLALLHERLSRKAKKRYGRNYALLVVVEDHLVFRNGPEREALVKGARKCVNQVELDFGSVYLLGASGGFCLCVKGDTVNEDYSGF
ncbi:MAG: hypothetical protein ACK4E7_00175 [Permianibacter sp.]